MFLWPWQRPDLYGVIVRDLWLPDDAIRPPDCAFLSVCEIAGTWRGKIDFTRDGDPHVSGHP